MQPVPVEVAITTVSFYAIWPLLVIALLIAGRGELGRWRRRREAVMRQWRPALVLAALYAGAGLARGNVNPLAIGVFCQAMIGLAIARSIGGFEPLPVVRAVVQRRRALRAVLLMVVFGLLANLAADVAGSLGMTLAPLFGERNLTQQVAGSFHATPWQAFLILLGGAGVAEETLFRLVALSAIWRWTGRMWPAIVGTALLFAAYHFTPLDGQYRMFWQFPIAQFLSTLLVGMIWGLVYVKRGLETAIAGHTLLDWITFVVLAPR